MTAINRHLRAAAAQPPGSLDEQALARIYHLYSSQVYRVAIRVLGDPAQAEDVTQDVFLAAWRTRASLDPSRGCLRPWLLAATRNRAIDLTRGCRGRRRFEEDVPADLPAPAQIEKSAIDRLDRQAILSALSALPVSQRRVVEQAYFEGRTAREIAALGGVPIGTVKSRMRLALARLAGDRELRAATTPAFA
jgi:RNA polymerase sigma-70 factor (ECF subfamily)